MTPAHRTMQQYSQMYGQPDLTAAYSGLQHFQGSNLLLAPSITHLQQQVVMARNRTPSSRRLAQCRPARREEVRVMNIMYHY